MKKDNTSLVSFDTAIMTLIEQDGDKFLLEANAEDSIVAWIEFLDRVEEVNKMVKQKFSEKMDELNCKKVEGENISVTKRFYGTRFEVSDPQLALDIGVAEKVEVIKPVSAEIERYEKDTGELPEGIKLRERAEIVSFVKPRKKGKKDEA